MIRKHAVIDNTFLFSMNMKIQNIIVAKIKHNEDFTKDV